MQSTTGSAHNANSAGTPPPLKDIAIVSIGILLTMLPVTMIVPALKELVSVRLDADEFWAHVFMSTSLVGAILFAPLAGYLIDRSKNTRMIMVLSLFGDGLCFFGMAVATTLPVMLAIRFIEGIMHITALTAWMTSGANMSEDQRAGRVMGMLGGMIILGIAVGVPLGGVVAKISVNMVLWSAGFVALLSAAFSLFAYTRPNMKAIEGKATIIFKMLRANRWMGIPYAYTFIDRLCVGVIVTTFTFYMSDVLGFEPAERGIKLTYFLLPFAILSYPAGRISDTIHRGWMMVGGSAFYGIVFMTYGFLTDASISYVMVISGVLSAVMFAPSIAMCKDLSREEQHGSAFAGYNMAGNLGFIIGPFLGGTILSILKQNMPIESAYQWTFITAGSFEVVCALVSLPFILKLIRRQRAQKEAGQVSPVPERSGLT